MEPPQSSGLPGSTQRDRGDPAAPRLLPSTSSPGLGKLAGTLLAEARSSPPARPHAAHTDYFPRPPRISEFCQGSGARGGPGAGCPHRLPAAASPPFFVEIPGVISKLGRRDHRQGPKTGENTGMIPNKEKPADFPWLQQPRSF